MKARIFTRIATLCMALMSTASVWATPLLEAEINPDPVQSGQMIDSQIFITNPTDVATGALVLRVLWPAELNATPVAPGSNNCVTNCQPGEFLVWDLGVLAAGGSLAVSFNENVKNVADGTMIPIEIDLSEAMIEVATLSFSVEVQSDSPLEIAVDPLSDPVASGTNLVYEIVYGNSSDTSSEASVLDFPVPTGTAFVSATAGGMLNAGTVSWSLGSLAPHSGGRQRVTVQLDALDDASLLLVDAATLSGNFNAQPRTSRAMAVSRVDTELLQLGLEVNPDPVNPSQLLDSQILVSNSSESASGSLSLQVLWPEELNGTPVAPGSDNCVTNCNVGEYLIWDLGVLGPGITRAVSFNEIVRSNFDGELLPLEVELIEGGFPARNISHTANILDDSPLEIAVDPLSDPVASGAMLVYEILYGNDSDVSAENSMLDFPVPTGTALVSTTGGGVLADAHVSWSLGSLASHGGGRERVTVQVDALDDASLLVVDAATLSGDLNFLRHKSRAMAVSRVHTEALQLSITVDPNPVLPGQVLNVELSVNNPSGNASGGLVLRVLWPEELNATPDAPGSDNCVTNCNPGEYLVWNLGVLGPGAEQVVSFSENVRANLPNGTLFPLEAELIEGGLPAQTASETVLIHPFDDFDGDGEADVFDEDDDNDGMPDWCEILWGLDPFDPSDADDDPDGDGFTNLEECQNGTNPFVNDNILFMDGFESD